METYRFVPLRLPSLHPERNGFLEELPSIRLILGQELYKDFNDDSVAEALDSMRQYIPTIITAEIVPSFSKSIDCEWVECQETFSTRTGLASKKRKVDLICQWNNCGRSFPNQRELVKHLSQESHVGQTPFIPRIIPKKNSSSSQKKTYSCSHLECGKSFSDASNRKKHELTHDVNRERYHCHHGGCIKSYSTRTDLKIHTKVHTGDFSYKCSHADCNRAFVRISELYAHERTHDKIMPHLCAICGKGFKDKTKWSIHQEIHK